MKLTLIKRNHENDSAILIFIITFSSMKDTSSKNITSIIITANATPKCPNMNPYGTLVLFLSCFKIYLIHKKQHGYVHGKDGIIIICPIPYNALPINCS